MSIPVKPHHLNTIKPKTHVHKDTLRNWRSENGIEFDRLAPMRLSLSFINLETNGCNQMIQDPCLPTTYEPPAGAGLTR